MSGSRGRRVSSLGPWPWSASPSGEAGGYPSPRKGAADDDTYPTAGRDRSGNRECAHRAGARRDRADDRETQGVADRAEFDRCRDHRVGRHTGGHPVGGGRRADRPGVAADRGVLHPPRSPGAPGELGQGRRPAPVLVPAHQDQRHRRRHPRPAAAVRPSRAAAAGAARRRAGRAGPAGPGHRPAHPGRRGTQASDQGPGPAAAADVAADRGAGGRRPGRAGTLRRPEHPAPVGIQATHRVDRQGLPRPPRQRPGAAVDRRRPSLAGPLRRPPRGRVRRSGRRDRHRGPAAARRPSRARRPRRATRDPLPAGRSGRAGPQPARRRRHRRPRPGRRDRRPDPVRHRQGVPLPTPV